MQSNIRSTVIGSNFASLVFATTRSNYENIDFIHDSSLKNHFAGTKLGDEWVDCGMVLLEPTVATSQRAIDSYRGEFRGEAAGFVHEFFLWLAAREISLEETNIKTYFRGEIVEDFFIADSLEILNTLTNAEQKQSSAELLEIIHLGSSEKHPSRKRKGLWFKTATYQQASNASMGETITKTILEPWLYKVYGTTFKSLLAIEHRSAWVPLFYPESLLEYFTSRTISFKQPKFVYPVNKSFASVVRQMNNYIESRCNVINALNFEIQNLTNISNLVYFGDPSFLINNFSDLSKEMLTGEGKFKKKMSPGKVVFLECSKSETITIFIVDIKNRAFRLSIRPSAGGTGSVAIVEYGHSAFGLSESELIADARETVEFMIGASTLGVSANIEIAFPIRTSGFLEVDKLYSQSKAIMTDIGWLGTPIGELNSSLNDQACAALHAKSVREYYDI